jgi:hypothetical protein
LAEPTDPEQPVYDRWSRPQALSNRGYLLAVLVPVLIAAAAFGVVSLVSSGDETARGVSVHLPVSGLTAGSGGDTVIEGVLDLDANDCVYLDSNGTKVWPVWPAGYHASIDNGRLSLFRANDTTAIAVDGSHVRMSGATAPVGNFATEPCLPDSGDVAVVESDVQVLQ